MVLNPGEKQATDVMGGETVTRCNSEEWGDPPVREESDAQPLGSVSRHLSPVGDCPLHSPIQYCKIKRNTRKYFQSPISSSVGESSRLKIPNGIQAQHS